MTMKPLLQAAALGALLIAMVACNESSDNKSTADASRLPKIQTITGETIDFKHLKRSWVIVNYWADWCEPCKKEIPELNEFADSHDNVYMIAVNYDGVDSRRLRELIARNEIHYFNALTDPTDELGVGDIPGLPVTLVFDKHGKLHKKLFGPQTKASLEKAIT